jgi:hypothetical protein
MKPPTKTAVSPGHDSYSRARGVPVANKPAVIDNSFVSGPRGNGGIVAKHGVRVVPKPQPDPLR